MANVYLDDKPICYHCIDEPYLKREIKQAGKRVTCAYCSRRSKGIFIGDLAIRVDIAFSQHYTRKWDPDEDPEEWPDGQPIIEAIRDAAGIPKEAAEDIRTILDRDNYDPNLAYMGELQQYSTKIWVEQIPPHAGYWQTQWSEYERILKTESRYFSRSGIELLNSVFRNVYDMETFDDESPLRLVGPGTSMTELYRARVFQSDTALKTALSKPDKELGCPPAAFAVAGRMNAPGISVFYGSNDPKLSLAEVRPAVGSKVAIAKFRIIRPLQLLDLNALTKLVIHGSIFDSDYADELSRAMFLKSLSAKMTQPVMPNDQSFEYLLTQSIADYLATEWHNMYDGIIFPSSQVEGESVNVILFHKAAKVEPVTHPKEAQIDVITGYNDGEGWKMRYEINEIYPEQTTETDTGKSSEKSLIDMKRFFSEDHDDRKDSLAIDPDSIVIHTVKAVNIVTEPFPVKRQRTVTTNKSILKDE
ncbi:RES family NAD+ phosphorylase [Mucilaginibacter sp. SJ]|uniref:RES family NAD+ phosphorylase n=1 Tax=Mucilaginibacter sp. SJ TaxID=3029053 RepID=UPI0023AA145F|nr:RES family NAD+ phosphorylase [Mucilaginibacter sp. SJ]WEA00705.1 RES family NAD+ phosphorylase [Mucilaginibacter sp. SJ]